ncbi:MAG: XRE family transcriptional regulator [Novosphingobium sp.]
MVRGSGNVFADLALPDPELEQLRAILAAEISKALTADKLTVRAAAELTGVAAADFSRIRQVRLKGFTVDRMMTILDRLNRQVKVSISVLARNDAIRSKAA